MDYWVYENSVHNKAVIHSANCSHCNNGKGRTNMDDGSRTRDFWHGPFKTLESVQIFAMNTLRKNIKSCYFCAK